MIASQSSVEAKAEEAANKSYDVLKLHAYIKALSGLIRYNKLFAACRQRIGDKMYVSFSHKISHFLLQISFKF